MNIEELKRLAEAATPGPWSLNDLLSDMLHDCIPDNDAAYMAAANPQAVLDLIAEVERLREQREYFREKSRGHFDAVIGAIEELKAMQDQRDELLAALIGLRDDIVGLMYASEGVTGLHKNGDVAPWSELEPGGQYEWLTCLADANAAIAKAEAGEVPASTNAPAMYWLLRRSAPTYTAPTCTKPTYSYVHPDDASDSSSITKSEAWK